MELNQLLTITQQHCRIDDEVELKTMLDFYHDLGVIVMHGQTVVLQALWLIKLFKQLITVRPFDKMVNNDTPHNGNSNNNDNDSDNDCDNDNDSDRDSDSDNDNANDNDNNITTIATTTTTTAAAAATTTTTTTNNNNNN